MSLDSTFADLAHRGWLVNNFYQYDSGLWRANLRMPAPDGDYFTEWAEGGSLEEVLEDCISKLNDAEFTPNRETSHSVESRVDLSTILGITRPTITRR